MEEIVSINNFRSIKYFEEELLDIYIYVSDFMKNHNEKEIITCYESIMSHKIDRLCFGIPNFILSVDIFKMVKEIYLKLIDLKEKKQIKNEEEKIITEMYFRFKYLMEWCIFYYEETYMAN